MKSAIGIADENALKTKGLKPIVRMLNFDW
jgi:hypothetical protein